MKWRKDDEIVPWILFFAMSSGWDDWPFQFFWVLWPRITLVMVHFKEIMKQTTQGEKQLIDHLCHLSLLTWNNPFNSVNVIFKVISHFRILMASCWRWCPTVMLRHIAVTCCMLVSKMAKTIKHLSPTNSVSNIRYQHPQLPHLMRFSLIVYWT